LQEPLRETLRRVILTLLEASKKSSFVENEYIKSKTGFTSEVILNTLKYLESKKLVLL